jgi:hypothetical protein
LKLLSSNVFLRTMTFQPLANAPSMNAFGRASRSVNVMVEASRTAIASTAENNGVRGLMKPWGGKSRR